jgi:hypothetical protein
MRGAMGAIALALAVPVLAQETGGYAAGENPFQGEYPFAAGQPISLKVTVEGVNLDTLTLAPEPASGDTVSCPVTFDGSNQGSGKVTVTAVVLLEDAKGKTLERLTMAQFRVKSGRPFSRREAITVQAASLTAAAKVYLFVKVE